MGWLLERWFTPRRGAATKELNAWIQSGPADAVVDAYTLLSCGDPERLCPDFRGAVQRRPAFREEGA